MNPLVFGIDDCYLMSQTGQLELTKRIILHAVKQSILKEHNIFGDNIKLLNQSIIIPGLWNVIDKNFTLRNHFKAIHRSFKPSNIP